LSAGAARCLVVNADDLGLSAAVNRGIVEAHEDGIVTSASLMVTGEAAAEAAALAREHPRLGVGLHADLDSPASRRVDLASAADVARELDRQLAGFEALLGRPPTHLDSHHHVHRRPMALAVFSQLAGRLGIPLRAAGPVRHVGRFWGGDGAGRATPERVGVAALEAILAEEVGEGWTEISCHPGKATPAFRSSYLAERELELATLTDPRIRATIERLGLRLVSYADGPPSA
jgi:predicted glycoside hydrolase/deacetylase ChbG (UPF0249 family)